MYKLSTLLSLIVVSLLFANEAILLNMAKGDYAKASKAKSAKITSSQGREEFLLKARALYFGGNYTDAITLYKKIYDLSDSLEPSFTKAQFGLAQCYAKLNQYKEAERYQRAGLAQLTSTAMKENVASQFYEEAKTLFDNESSLTIHSATSLYDLALRITRSGPLYEEILLSKGKAFLHKKDTTKAVQTFRSLIDSFPHSPYYWDALYASAPIVAKRYSQWGNYILTTIERSAPNDSMKAEALLLKAEMYGFPNPQNSKDLFEGIDALDTFISRYPTHVKVDDALFAIATAPLSSHIKRPFLADSLLENYQKKGTSSERKIEVAFLKAQSLALQLKNEDAIKAYEKFIRANPFHKKTEAAHSAIENIYWTFATEAFKNKQWKGAIKEFENYISRYKEKERAAESYYKKGLAQLELANEKEALANFDTLQIEHPTSSWFRLGELKRAELILKKDPSSKIAYTLLEEHAEKGKQRDLLYHWGDTSLSIEATSPFLSSDEIILNCNIQGLDSVEVALFAIDEEQYFREKRLMNKIATIAIELCTPQKIKTFKPQFPKAKTPVQEHITLPINEPGVYLVRVSGGSLEAVTTVTISDLQAVMKVGPTKTMIYVEDRKTGKRVPQARVLLTDHKNFTKEGVTNKEGIYETNYTVPNESSHTLQAFISSGSQICWINKEDFYIKSEKTSHVSSRIFCDKEIYSPNDTTVLTLISPSTICTVSVQDSQNRVVYQQIIAPTTHQLVTAKIPPQRHRIDTYKVYLNNREQCDYRVGENSFVSKKKDYSLTLSLTDSLYHYGDTIKGLVTLISSQGNEINKLPVFIDSDLGSTEVQTNEKGVAQFTLPVHSLIMKSQSVAVYADIDPLKLSDSTIIHYIEDEFSLSLSSSGDQNEMNPLSLTLHYSNPVGNSKTETATLHLFKCAEYTESKVFTQALTLGKDSLTLLTFRKFHPGDYRAEIQSRDRKGNRVLAEHFFTIRSREELDSTALLVTLSDTLYTPNEKLRATIRTNRNKGHFFCTFETDSILSKHLIPIKKGINTIELPLPDGIVPNATFSVSLFEDNSRLQSFKQNITVSKELVLSLKEIPKPTAGDSIQLQIAVSNAKEKAANATLSIFIHENQWGVHSPQRFYTNLFTEQIHNISNYLYDTLYTSKMFGQRMKGVTTEYRHERTGYTAFEEIRKELTKEAKEEYAGIGSGFGRESGFGGGSGGLGDLESLSGLGGSDKAVVRRKKGSHANRRPYSLGDHFKEYWIATSITEFARVKTDVNGIATVTVAIPDSIKGGLHISAIAVNDEGYLGSFADTLTIIEREHETVTPEASTLPKEKMTHYTIRPEKENSKSSIPSIQELLENAPVYTAHEKDILNTILLSKGWKKENSEEQISSLLALLHNSTTGGTAADKVAKEIATLELIQRVDSLPDWIDAKSYMEKYTDLMITAIKEEKSWYRSLRQMAFLASSAPTKLPLIKLQRADREQKTLSPRAIAALAKVWQNLNRPDKVTPLIPEISNNLRKEIASEMPNRDLIITSCEVLLKEREQDPLLADVMNFVVETLLPATLHRADDLSRVASILADYYGKSAQGFTIHKSMKKADSNSAITLNREFIAITKNYLGQNLDPIHAGGDTGDTIDWQTDSLKSGDYLIAKVTVKSDTPYKLIEYIPHGFSLVTTKDQSMYNRKYHSLELKRDSSSVFYYILQAHTEGLKEFVPATLLAEKLQRVGSVDTVFILSPQSEFVYPLSPHTVEEMGIIAYDRGFPARALPLFEEARQRGLESNTLFKDILFCAIESDDNEKIVSYFEQAKEINPNLLIPFEKIAPIQKAYQTLGLFESGYLLAKGTTESRFIEEMNIIGSLESIAPRHTSLSKSSLSRNKSRSNTKSSIETMKRVTAAYPHGALHSRSLYLFSHLLYDRIDIFKNQHTEELQEEKKRLLPVIEDLLQHYLAEYQHPVSFDNARFTLAAASLDEGDNRKAIAWTYPEAKTTKTMGYTVQSIRAYALFLEDRFSDAETLCRSIMDTNEIDKASKDLATYILAQIYHGQGDMEKALKLYEKIANQFEDAQYILAKSATKEIELPEIHSLSGSNNKLPVTLKNIDSVLIKTYPIDLVRFLEGGSAGSDKRKINLSGITPLFTKAIVLPKRIGISRKHTFETGISQNGTYLTFVQSADTTLYAILVKGDINLSIDKIDYQTLHISTEERNGKPLSDATLIIKDTDRLIYAKSDKRGVYKTDVQSASPVVIAKKGNSYGVYLKKSDMKRATFKKKQDQVKAKASPIQYMEKMRDSYSNSNNNFFNQEIQGVMLNQLEN